MATDIFQFERELDSELVDEIKVPLPRPWSEDWYKQQVASLGQQICQQIGIYAIPDSFVLSIVIPVYNEEKSIGELIDRVLNVPIRKEIILVDDGSRDRSVEKIEQLIEQFSCPWSEIRLIKHAKNKEKVLRSQQALRKRTAML